MRIVGQVTPVPSRSFRVVAAIAPMTKRESLFQKRMAFYYQYLQGEPRFDCRRALDALKNTGIECPPVTVELINRIIGWYVDLLNAKAT